MLHIVLVHPEIPPNTGNVIRLAANTGCALHLIEPLGFSMDDKLLQRAGLDYHEYAEVKRHASWPAFLDAQRPDPQRLFAFTTARQPTDRRRRVRSSATGCVFGGETRGLPPSLLDSIRIQPACAPADARRPAQPEPEQCGGGGRVRSVAPVRLRGRILTVRAVLGPRFAAHQSRRRLRRREAPLEHLDHHVGDRHLDAERTSARRHGRRADHAFGHVAEVAQDARRAPRRAPAAGRPGGCATGHRSRSARGRPALTSP